VDPASAGIACYAAGLKIKTRRVWGVVCRGPWAVGFGIWDLNCAVSRVLICGPGIYAALDRSVASLSAPKFFDSDRVRPDASPSAATALLQLLTRDPSGHADSGTADLSYRLIEGLIEFTP